MAQRRPATRQAARPRPRYDEEDYYEEPPRRRRRSQPLKSPGLAAVLSLFIPGVGQIYNGQLGKGLLILLLLVPLNIVLSFVVIGFVTGFITWIWGIFDAYKTAEKINLNG